MVGGLDPGGGAGILRDALTAAALGASAHAVGTGWTQQGAGVHQVEARAPEAVEQALRQAIAAGGVAAVKVGMAVGPATVQAILAGLAGYRGPVVVDPVLATSRGGALWAGPPDGLLPLLRRATLVTPNASEAAALANQPVATVEDAESAAQGLVARQRLAAVLVKGGHLAGEGPITDILVTPAAVNRLTHDRVPGPSPRGTGCALATAAAIALGQGQSLPSAIRWATRWLQNAITTARAVGTEVHLGIATGAPEPEDRPPLGDR